MEKISREELRKENIIKDLVKYEKEMRFNYLDWRLSYIIPFILIAVLLGIFTRQLWVVSVVALPAVYHLIMLIKFFVVSNKKLASMKRGEFTITLDKLTNVSHETIYSPHYSKRRTRLTREVDFLWFGGSKWRILQSKLYSWSENFYLTHNGLLNTSVIGNEFYIVLFGKAQEIYCVYNTKFFVWNK